MDDHCNVVRLLVGIIVWLELLRRLMLSVPRSLMVIKCQVLVGRTLWLEACLDHCRRWVMFDPKIFGIG